MFEYPICLDTPYMFGYCLDAHHTYTTQESMLCHTKGVSICPHTFGYPPVCLNTPYVWTPPICLDHVWMPPVHTQQKKHALSH